VANENWKEVHESTDIAWIKQSRDNSDPTSPNWHVAQERPSELMHEELLPKPWYRTGLGWIAFLTLIATLAGIIIAFVLR
jgi:hypothetical protein